MRSQAGFSLLETLLIVSIFVVLAAVCAPSITKAHRTYQLQSAAQQIVQELQRAKINALGHSTRQPLIFDPTNRTMTANGTAFALPDGIRFEALPTTINPPALVQQAAQNSAALPAQQSDARSAISFSVVATAHTLSINTKGLPDVEPGVVNWIYLVNRDSQRAAITITSAGSVALLTLRDGMWK
jgi:Tfp pilus assembly protein FimT